MNSYKKLNTEYKDMIVRDINKSELTYKEICNKYDISYATYRLISKEYNLSRKIAKRKSNNTIDDDFFEVINTEEKAYWLGFLYADGAVVRKGEYYTVVIALSTIDKEHIYKFKKSLNTSYKVREYVNKSGNSYCKIECCSKKLFNDLVKLGCFERKTLILNFPTQEQVPDNLIHHFMRGYFDGDGTINSHREVGNKRDQVRFQILGTENFIKGFINKLPLDSNIKENITLQKTKNIITIQIGGNIRSKKIFDFLYKDSHIYLDRKHDKYIKYFNR